MTDREAPSAARWLQLTPDGVRAVDVVAELLALDPRTRLRSRDGGRLRAVASAVEQLLQAGAVCPSGVPLLDVLVHDADVRAHVEPQVDDLDAGLAALLGGDEPERRSGDRTIRLADELMARAAAHRAGEVDLRAAVAPPGPGLHPHGDQLASLLADVLADVALPANPAPAVVTCERGWLPASPVELFWLTARGAVRGDLGATVGEGLARWFDGWTRGPDPWRTALTDRVEVDADGLLHDAAVRSGSDHPVVVGAALAEAIAGRHLL